MKTITEITNEVKSWAKENLSKEIYVSGAQGCISIKITGYGKKAQTLLRSEKSKLKDFVLENYSFRTWKHQKQAGYFMWNHYVGNCGEGYSMGIKIKLTDEEHFAVLTGRKM